ncbi:MAG: glycine cleavage system protein R [Oceanobacter sp.]|jgi:glycine cleavage system regulatory protein
MSISLVLTVIADDKPGIVEQVAAVVRDHQGNWLESRMATMAGKFAGILRINIAEDRSKALLEGLSALQSQGIEVRAERGSADSATTVHLTLSVIGNDRPGIVQEVSAVLARHHVNVQELITGCFAAEMSATPTFRAEAELEVPEDFDQDELADDLESLSDELMVEIRKAV